MCPPLVTGFWGLQNPVTKSSYFLQDVTRVLCPPLVTGFWGPQNPVTRGAHPDHFRANKFIKRKSQIQLFLMKYQKKVRKSQIQLF